MLEYSEKVLSMLTYLLIFFPLVALIGGLAKSCHLCFCLISIHFKGIFWKLLVYVCKAI